MPVLLFTDGSILICVYGRLHAWRLGPAPHICRLCLPRCAVSWFKGRDRGGLARLCRRGRLLYGRCARSFLVAALLDAQQDDCNEGANVVCKASAVARACVLVDTPVASRPSAQTFEMGIRDDQTVVPRREGILTKVPTLETTASQCLTL